MSPMQYAAILHRPMSEYAFPLDEGHFVFRLRTAKGDLKRLFSIMPIERIWHRN